METVIHHGIEGFEAIYSSHSDSDEQLVRSFAKKHHLLITGGSDYHGSNKPIPPEFLIREIAFDGSM